ncbi:hypothetical protein [Streptomyces carpaticus]|uniref:Uncharacterized protein n=1 Tax=Streptomyces carpaticus TaxID=285558 RepID=A0ABV4ZNI1_9ACTN
MTSNDPAVGVVPVRLDALLVNADVRKHEKHSRAGLRFRSDFEDPEPLGTDFTPLTEQDNGVHLHWHLPEAVAQGLLDSSRPGAEVAFPPAPNRWLVIRYHHPQGGGLNDAPTAAGWLVRSDYHSADPTLATSPVASDLWLGTSVDLSTDTWEEKDTGRTQLTSQGIRRGPRVPAFCVFQPYCRNVFSFHDPLTGHADGKLYLSYRVIGWNSHPDDDVASPAHLEHLLNFLGDPATVTTDVERTRLAMEFLGFEPVGQTAGTRSLYHGTVLGLYWDKGRDRPPRRHFPSDVGNSVRLAVGHAAPDAVAALVEGTLPRTGDHPTDEACRVVADHLRAFHTGKLGVMERVVGGAAEQRHALDTDEHRDWFGPVPGGTVWQVSDDRTTGADPLPPITYDQLRAALTSLNRAQRRLDQAARDAADLRCRLGDLWWLKGRYDSARHRPDFDIGSCEQHLTPDIEIEPPPLAAEWQRAWERAREAASARNTALTNLRGVLPTGWSVKATPREPFYEPVDPVVLVRGAGQPHSGLRRGTPRPRRTTDQILTGIRYTPTDTDVPVVFTAPATPHLPKNGASATSGLPQTMREAVARLQRELSVLHDLARYRMGQEPTLRDSGTDLWDPARITTNTGEKPPEGTEAWRQPWTPLSLAWTADCYPLPEKAADGTSLWAFDGTRRTLSSDAGAKKDVQERHEKNGAYVTLSGRALVTSVPTFTLCRGVDAHQRTFPGSPREFDTFRATADTWDLLSQSLSGVRAALLRRAPGAARAPEPDGLPGLLTSPQAIWPRPDGTAHQPVPAAQMALREAVLLDTFGQATSKIIGTTKYAPHLSRYLTPPYSVDKSDDGKRFFQLPPRLAQPARLCLTPLEHAAVAGDLDRPVDADSDPLLTTSTPVCGWLTVRNLPSPETFVLTVHGRDGTALGEVRRVGPAGHLAVTWWPLPDSTLRVPEDLFGAAFAASDPALAGFLRGLVDRDADAITHGGSQTSKPTRFAELAAALHTALLHLPPPPPDGPAMAAGRVLALVRLRVHLELDGTPRTDPRWNKVFHTTEDTDPAYRTRRWPVRLGTATDPTDGLIGYFTNADSNSLPGDTSYELLRTVHPATGAYTRSIADGAHLTVAARPAALSVEPRDAAYLTALVEPRLAIHAHTDIQPVARFRMPPSAVDATAERLPLSLPIGPVLARVRATTGATPRRHITLPPPSAAGRWEFAALGHTRPRAWQHLDLTSEQGQSPLEPVAPDAHTGYLTRRPSRQDHRAQENP